MTAADVQNIVAAVVAEFAETTPVAPAAAEHATAATPTAAVTAVGPIVGTRNTTVVAAAAADAVGWLATVASIVQSERHDAFAASKSAGISASDVQQLVVQLQAFVTAAVEVHCHVHSQPWQPDLAGSVLHCLLAAFGGSDL